MIDEGLMNDDEDEWSHNIRSRGIDFDGANVQRHKIAATRKV